MAYNLTYRLTIVQIDKYGNEIGKPIVIRPPLSMKFDVVRMPMMGSTYANIDIYNLQPSTRDKIFLDYFNLDDIRRVTLEAGYENGKFDTIYRGRVLTCRPIKERTEVIMRLEAQSGFFAMDAYIQASTAEGQLITDIAQMSLEKTEGAVDYFIQPEPIQLSRPVALDNNELAVLETYTRGKAFIDNDKVISINESDVIDGDVRVISDETGLLGVPERKEVTVTVKCIFEPRIKVGQGLEIRSRIAPIFTGQYKVWGVAHSGTIGLASSSQCITTIQLWTGLNLFGRFRTKFNTVYMAKQNV